ncbi:uncharacterized protein LOC127861477 isoform X2 [Dreissena polymorpha]|uniref:Uncharacterized protein n=1 Tax=Dreissena polymorpha TaxID=45954 RepID=A0A9D3YBG4_DREPO|nr:uncharacterized protein LOC127861477 isoform X2 [Dreissena polymorpha]KAH3695459.1 hypothetical protein DPMN_082919 [Dreissena polymorpha]
MVGCREVPPAHIMAPDNIELRNSTVDKTRIGAFSRQLIPKGLEFGPFEGRIVHDKDDPSVNQKYSWEVFDLKTLKYLHTVDATNPADGNWMRYVCCARYFEEQNIVSTQNKNHVYYKALKDITEGEELLTWFQAKKKRRKRSSASRLSLDAQDAPDTSHSAEQTDSPPASPSKQKRKRKPKIIPDSYDGPLDFELHQSRMKKSASDEFEPLQPGQKRRRRKKTVDASDSAATSNAASPLRESTSPGLEFFSENGNSLCSIKTENNDDVDSMHSLDTGKGRKSQSIAKINEGVDWDYPKSGCEYTFDLMSCHVVNQAGKKVYKCDICMGIYKHMFSLKRHYLRNHVNYEYLSKADITNCLINLAQVKHYMSSKSGWKSVKAEQSQDADSEVLNGENEKTTNVSELLEVKNKKIKFEKNGIECLVNGNVENINNANSAKDCPKSLTSDPENSLNGFTEDSNSELNSSGNSVCSDSMNNKKHDKEVDITATVGSTHHKASKKSLPGLFRCYSCYRLFNTIPEIRDHLQTHAGDGDGEMFWCGDCNMHFSLKNNWIRHLKTHRTEDKELSDDSSDEEDVAENTTKKADISPLDAAEDHSLSNFPPKLDRPKPDKLKRDPDLATSKKPDGHTLPSKHHAASVFKCGVCPVKTDSKEAIMAHVAEMHKIDSKFQCQYCGKDFLSLPNMKKHVRFHLGYRATCRECSETFSNVGSLRKHTRVNHPEVYRARLVERLEKYGVLRGPDKNALKKKVIEKVKKKKAIVKHIKDSEVSENSLISSENSNAKSQSEEKDCGKGAGVEVDVKFAADEIDEGEGRFKFSCTVCKKRFSSYLLMCRHRRKVHNNETKQRHEHLTYETIVRSASPIVDNPEEIAAFYANVSHNIATNLNCYIDGKAESLEKFVDHIKVEDYVANFQCCENGSSKVNFEQYNFPKHFIPCKTISLTETDTNVNFHCTSAGSQSLESSIEETAAKETVIESEKTACVAHKKKEETKSYCKTIDPKVNENKIDFRDKIGVNEEQTVNKSGVISNSEVETRNICALVNLGYSPDNSNLLKMGIASYGMKVLSNLVMAKKTESKNKAATNYYNLKIANGHMVNNESPAAKTFHQVQLGEYANFQDDLLAVDAVCPVIKRKREQGNQPLELDDAALQAECVRLNKSAQNELEALYAEIDNHLSDGPASVACNRPVETLSAMHSAHPRRLSQICEQALGLSPRVQQSVSVDHKNNESNSTGADRLSDDDEPAYLLRCRVNGFFKDQKADFSNAPFESPFYNYESIMFGKNGDIEHVCAVCKKHFQDFDGLLRHHWKKHPYVECSYIEVETGNEIENLHYSEPSCVGALAITEPGWDDGPKQETFRCSHCKVVFKCQSKLHTHIVHCSPIDPLYGVNKPDKTSVKTPLKKKIQRKIQSMFGNDNTAKSRLDFDAISLDSTSSSRSKSSGSLKRVFTGSRKRISVILPDSPEKEIVEPVSSVTPQKSAEPVITGYNPHRHVRRRELTELVDLLTCEGCGLKCKTIILLERHVRHCTRKEKFKTIKPLACPIIDDSEDKTKNVCFYCEKSFTYTKSLVNHFQDFCPVKKAKLDQDTITEMDRRREAAILDRIQKSEDEKQALKERELENNSKRRITWQVGRKPKRKGNAWTAGRRKSSQTDEQSPEAVDNNEDGDELSEIVSTESRSKSLNQDFKAEQRDKETKPMDDENEISAGILKVEKDEEEFDNDNEENMDDSANTNTDLNNMSLNCTVRFAVNKIRKEDLKSVQSNLFSKNHGNLLLQCVMDQNSEKDNSDEVQRKTYRKNEPDSTRIVEGKRKRERVGKVEEFLKSAFSRKRKKKDESPVSDSSDQLKVEKVQINEAEIEGVGNADKDDHMDSIGMDTNVDHKVKSEPDQIKCKKTRGRPRKNPLDKKNDEQTASAKSQVDEVDGTSTIDACETSTNGHASRPKGKRGRPKVHIDSSVSTKLQVIRNDSDEDQVVPECQVETESCSVNVKQNNDCDNIGTESVINVTGNVRNVTSDKGDGSYSAEVGSNCESEGNYTSDVHKVDNSIINICDRRESPHFQIKTTVDKNNVICNTEINLLDSSSQNNEYLVLKENHVDEKIINEEVINKRVTEYFHYESSFALNSEYENPDDEDCRSDVTKSTEPYTGSREVSPEKEIVSSNTEVTVPFHVSESDKNAESMVAIELDINSSEKAATISTYDGSNTSADNQCSNFGNNASDDKHEVSETSRRNRRTKVDEVSTEESDVGSTSASESTDNNEDDLRYPLVLSPSERVKMNKRSCKKDVDITSPVWVRRTQKTAKQKLESEIIATRNKVLNSDSIVAKERILEQLKTLSAERDALNRMAQRESSIEQFSSDSESAERVMKGKKRKQCEVSTENVNEQSSKIAKKGDSSSLTSRVKK